MNHEVYETQMFETINQHGEAAISEKPKVKRDTRVLIVGLKRTLLALLTATLVAVAVIGFVAVAGVKGYMAVLLFFASILALVCSYILMYAQGIAPKTTQESKGENK